MIEATGLSKRYGATLAVDDLSFIVPPGQVTGFLGPNGAGKSTTMRMILGLGAPTSGSVTVNGRPYAEYRRPLFEVGALLDAQAVHGGRSAYNHLLCLAQSNGIGRSRVDEVLDAVGLRSVARKRSGGFSLGMGQRLGIAASLLREPRLLVLDEPTSGLDPGGVRDITRLFRDLAADGVSILLSSHHIEEVEEVCDSFTILRRGRVVWDGIAEELRAQAPASSYHVITSDDARALELAEQQRGVRAISSRRGGLALAVDQDALDPYVLALGAAGVAVRRLELLASPVESMFFALTGGQPEPDRSTDAEIAPEALAKR